MSKVICQKYLCRIGCKNFKPDICMKEKSKEYGIFCWKPPHCIMKEVDFIDNSFNPKIILNNVFK